MGTISITKNDGTWSHVFSRNGDIYTYSRILTGEAWRIGALIEYEFGGEYYDGKIVDITDEGLDVVRWNGEIDEISRDDYIRTLHQDGVTRTNLPDIMEHARLYDATLTPAERMVLVGSHTTDKGHTFKVTPDGDGMLIHIDGYCSIVIDDYNGPATLYLKDGSAPEGADWTHIIEMREDVD